MDGRTDGWKDGGMDMWTDGRPDMRMDRWTAGRTDILSLSILPLLPWTSKRRPWCGKIWPNVSAGLKPPSQRSAWQVHLQVGLHNSWDNLSPALCNHSCSCFLCMPNEFI